MLAALERAREARAPLRRRRLARAAHAAHRAARQRRVSSPATAPTPRSLADIEADAARLSALVDDLLALAREDAAAPVRGEPVDLDELARAAAAADVDAEVERRPAGRRARRARRRSSARVGNLVATRAATGRRAAGSRVTRGRRRRVSVEDEGPRPAATPRTRSSASGAARAGEGSGLGLAIVRAIAERHGGRVDGRRLALHAGSQGVVRDRPYNCVVARHRRTLP